MFIVNLSVKKESLFCAVAASGLVVASESKRDFTQRQQSERYDHYSQKALHGYFVRSQDRNVDKVASVY